MDNPASSSGLEHSSSGAVPSVPVPSVHKPQAWSLQAGESETPLSANIVLREIFCSFLTKKANYLQEPILFSFTFKKCKVQRNPKQNPQHSPSL